MVIVFVCVCSLFVRLVVFASLFNFCMFLQKLWLPSSQETVKDVFGFIHPFSVNLELDLITFFSFYIAFLLFTPIW